LNEEIRYVKDEPLVSVIIPSYNHGHFVTDAIESVLKQSYKTIELLVVDDGSNDDTECRVMAYGDRLKYIKHTRNEGMSRARNTGIRNSLGEFIAFLDSDDIWLSEKLEMQIRLIRNDLDKKIGIVACGIYQAPSDGEIIREIRQRQYTCKEEIFETFAMKNIITCSASGVLIRRDCFKTSGFFDETLRAGEDWDMWQRISKHYQIAWLETPLVKIRVIPNSMSSSMNVLKMLPYELVVLKKIFSEEEFSGKSRLKRKAYSFRYSCTAWALCESGNKMKAIYYILKSLLLFPAEISLCAHSRLVLLLRIVIGENIFKYLLRFRNILSRDMERA